MNQHEMNKMYLNLETMTETIIKNCKNLPFMIIFHKLSSHKSNKIYFNISFAVLYFKYQFLKKCKTKQMYLFQNKNEGKKLLVCAITLINKNKTKINACFGEWWRRG